MVRIISMKAAVNLFLSRLIIGGELLMLRRKSIWAVILWLIQPIPILRIYRIPAKLPIHFPSRIGYARQRASSLALQHFNGILQWQSYNPAYRNPNHLTGFLSVRFMGTFWELFSQNFFARQKKVPKKCSHWQKGMNMMSTFWAHYSQCCYHPC